MTQNTYIAIVVVIIILVVFFLSRETTYFDEYVPVENMTAKSMALYRKIADDHSRKTNRYYWSGALYPHRY